MSDDDDFFNFVDLSKKKYVSDATREHLEKLSKSRILSPEVWLERFKSAHGDKYDYSKSLITGAKTKITIICPEHGEFEQIPKKHAKGQNCPLCAREIGKKKISEARKRNNQNKI